MNGFSKLNGFFNKLPTHLAIVLLMLIWIVPTVGLLVTSFRPVQAINSTGWWTVFGAQPGQDSYTQFCASCHGSDGKAIATADLTNPDLVNQFPRSLQMLAMLRKDINGKPHMGDTPIPSAQEAADIATYLKQISGITEIPRSSHRIIILILWWAIAAPIPIFKTAPPARSRRICIVTPAICSTRVAWGAPS